MANLCPETVRSTTALEADDIESIVVDDGSADETTHKEKEAQRKRNGCTPAQEIKIIVVVLEKSQCG